jgi:hypothetical protein
MRSSRPVFARSWHPSPHAVTPPNQRLKLSARGGRLVGKGSLLIAAAAGRSLSAIRYTAAATMTKALLFSGARATSS